LNTFLIINQKIICKITKQPNQNPKKWTENHLVCLKKEMHHHSSSEVAFNSFKATHLLFAFYFSHHQFVIMHYLFHKIRQFFLEMQRQSGKNIESLQLRSVYAREREGDRERDCK